VQALLREDHGFGATARTLGLANAEALQTAIQRYCRPFGTTAASGAYGFGTAFELTGSGFVPQAFAGQPGTADCYGESVLALLRKYQSLDAAALARGLGDAEALPTAILQYCGQSAPQPSPPIGRPSDLVQRRMAAMEPAFIAISGSV
jgi:hypothetical protein